MIARLLALALVSLPVAWADQGFEVGQQHPDFILPDLNGELGGLSAHLGQKLLVFHFASW